jgi:hypothetical protein
MPTVRKRQGFFRRVLNAIIRSRQVHADREIREILMRHGLTRRATIEAHEFRPTRCRFSDQG